MTVGKCKPRDPNQLVKWIVDRSTNEVEGPEAVTGPTPPSDLSQYMASIGRQSGQIGGKRRLKTMAPKEPPKLAIKAAKTRWKKSKV